MLRWLHEKQIKGDKEITITCNKLHSALAYIWSGGKIRLASLPSIARVQIAWAFVHSSLCGSKNFSRSLIYRMEIFILHFTLLISSGYFFPHPLARWSSIEASQTVFMTIDGSIVVISFELFELNSFVFKKKKRITWSRVIFHLNSF